MNGGTISGRKAGALALAALSLALAPRAALAQLGSPPRVRASGPSVATTSSDGLEARVWLDRGQEPLLRTGDQVRVYYRTTQDAYVAIFHIDTDGTTALVFPSSPDDDHFVRAGADYRVLFPRSAYWFVDDQPGLGYFFIVASPEPLDFSKFRFSRYDTGWDLGQIGRQVYRDPYVAMDDYVAALLPDWQQVPYALDFTSYDVGQHFEYPRFLCYDCHGFRSYAAWNPYYTTCTNFRVVVYDDPYFYPVRRYRADRVVWARPGPERSRFGFKPRYPGEPAAPLLQQVVGERTRGVLAAPPRRTGSNGLAVDATGRFAPVVRVAARAPGVVRAPATPSSGSASPADRTRQARPGDRMRAPASNGGAGATTGGASPSSGGSSSSGGVVAPRPSRPAESPSPGDRPGPGFAPTPDQRLRPVLRKRPSDDAGAPAPTATGASTSGAGQPPRQTPPSRPTDSRPTDSRGTGSRPSEARPAQPRAPESRPSEPRPAEARPVEPATQRTTRPRGEAAPSGSGAGTSTGAQPARERAPSSSGRSSGGSSGSSGGTGSTAPSRGDAPAVQTTPDGRKVIRRPG